MSIDARIVGARIVDGRVKLTLKSRESQTAAGQETLVISNPPDDVQSLIGLEIWGGSRWIYCGDKKWAKRHGYIHVELV